ELQTKIESMDAEKIHLLEQYAEKPFDGIKEYARKYGVKSMRHEFSVKYTSDNNLDHLIRLCCTNETPVEYKMIRYCNGVVLDCKNEWNVVCPCIPVILSHDNKHADKINWDNVILLNNYDAKLVYLYYCQQWLLSSNTNEEMNNITKRFWEIWKKNKCDVSIIDHNHILVFCIIDTQNQNIIEINNDDLILMSCFEKVEKNMFKEIDYQMIATKYKLKS